MTKKLLSIFIAVIMVFAFAACESNNTETTSQEVPFYSQDMTDNGMYKVTAKDYVTLPEYTGVAFGELFWSVSDEDVEEQIDAILEQYADVKQITDRAVAEGDSVNIDYVGTLDGVEFEGGNTNGAGATYTAGGEDLVDDFLTKIIGHMPGESFAIDITFPEGYSEELGGKDTVFNVTINYIEETTIPELTDEFVETNLSSTYPVNTVEELTTLLRDDLLFQTQCDYVQDFLVSNSEISEVPEEVINAETSFIRKGYEDLAASYNIDVDQFVTMYQAESLDELIETLKPDIEEAAKVSLLYQAVAEDLNLKITEDDVADYFENHTGSRDYSVYEEEYGLPYIKFSVMLEKVNNYIIENATKLE